MTKALTTYDEYSKMFNRIDQSNPTREDLLAIRTALAGNPELIIETCDLAKQARHGLIYGSKLSPVRQEITQTMMDELERELGYQDAPVLERLAIDQVLLCYLRLNLREQGYSAALNSGQLTFGQSHEWEKLLAGSQKRYVRALECLAKLRRQGIQIQVNIATEGGQQINLNRS